MRNSLFIGCLCVLFSVTSNAQSGKQYARSMTSVYHPGNTTHFLVFKPSDSSDVNIKHPLIIFLHGAGEIGTASPEDLLDNGGSIPSICANANTTMRFTVNGVTSSFYVLSPQCTGSDGFRSFYVKDMWTWAVNNLNVDTSRVYLTGLSYGGGGVWSFLLDSLFWVKRFAAIAPMAAITGGGDAELLSAITASDMSLWAFHATGDGMVPAPQSTGFYAQHWGFSNPNIRWTFYKNGNHNTGWINASDIGHTTYTVDSSSTYYNNYPGPSTTSFLQNPNLYEWFLTKSRSTVSTPSVNAGADHIIFTTSDTLVGSASITSPATITGYTWTVASGPSGSAFTSSSTATTIVNSLVPGTYVFRLTANGSNSTSAFDEVQVIVKSPTPMVGAGSDKTITANTTTLNGNASIGSPATITNYTWSVVSGPSGSSFGSGSSAITTVNNLVPGIYTFRLTATASTGGSGSDDIQITVNASTGCKVVWTSVAGSLGDIKNVFNLAPCDTLKIKSGTYDYLYIANSRFDGDVYVMASDSGVVFNGPWQISNVKNVVFKNFKIKHITGASALRIDSNTDSCTFEGFSIYDVFNKYAVELNGSGMSYNGTAATVFDNLRFINDTIRAVGNANAFSFNTDPVTRNLVMRGLVIDSTYGPAFTLSLNANAINLLIENCKFTNINIGGTQHNCVMYIQGNGIIRNNYGFNIQGDFMRVRPYTIDSSASHPNPDTLWVYNNREVSSVKYAFAEMKHNAGDTTTSPLIPNVRTGIGVFLNNTAGNLRSRDYWSDVNHGGGGAMFDVYDWSRKPIFKNNLAFRLDIDSVPDPANPPAAYNFDYMFHNAGGVKPPGESFGDTSNNLYRHIPAQLGINDTLTMKIADTSIARGKGTNAYSYKFNTDFEGEIRGSSWDIGADQNNNTIPIVGPPYWGMDSVVIGGRNCLVKRPIEDPFYSNTKPYPLILEIGDQNENLAENPSGLVGLFKSGTPKLLKDGVNIYPNDLNGHPIYYIMAKIQPLDYNDVAYPNEITPFVTGVLAAYHIDTSKYDNGMYRHIMLAGSERGADTWYNCTNWDIANGLGSTPPTWVYKISKIVTSKVNFINTNGNGTSDAVWQTFNGRKLRFFEPNDQYTLPDSIMARVARNSNAYELLFRLSTSSAQPVYDSMYSVKGVDTNTNIYRLLIDDSLITGGRYTVPVVNNKVGQPESPTGLIIHPNPVSGVLRISNDNGIRTLVIYSISGQQVFSSVPGRIDNMLEVDMSDLPRGIYLLRITDKRGLMQTRKIVKE